RLVGVGPEHAAPARAYRAIRDELDRADPQSRTVETALRSALSLEIDRLVVARAHHIVARVRFSLTRDFIVDVDDVPRNAGVVDSREPPAIGFLDRSDGR